MSAWRVLTSQLGRPAVVAHRGASRAAAENGLTALRLAAELGADAVEFDVQPCLGGDLVVFHDDTLARTTGQVGAVCETSLETLRGLSLDRLDRLAGRSPAGDSIPTLDEWLAEVPAGLWLNLEIKGASLRETAHSARCLAMIADAGLADRAVVSGFHPAALWRLMGLRGTPLAALVEAEPGWRGRLATFPLARLAAVHPPAQLVTPARVARWHRLGWSVATWTVDEPDEIERCLAAGVDAVITNRPDLARPIAERYA